MKVSFDFDGTLDRICPQRYALELVNQGVEVHVVTSRYSDEEALNHTDWFEQFGRYDPKTYNEDLFTVAEVLQIDKKNIHFTNMQFKCIFFRKNSDFVFHLDDMRDEIERLQQFTKVFPVYVKKSSWKSKCKKAIKKYQDTYLDDGFGNVWDKICPECGKRAMEIVRPGKAQCWNCG